MISFTSNFITMFSITQADFFAKMKNLYPHAELVTWIIQTLNVTRQTAYNYLEGKRNIHFDSMIKLLSTPEGQSAYSIHDMIQTSGKILWEYQQNIFHQNDASEYLKKLREQVRKIDPAKQSISFVTAELPIFYYMYFPGLVGFKLSCWSKTVWRNEVPYLPYSSSSMIDDEKEQMLADIISHYASINTIEFWNVNMLDTTLKQIRYFRQMEWFKSIRDYTSLVNDLKKLVILLKEVAEGAFKQNYNRKSAEGKSVVYENDIFFSSNVYMICGEGRDVVFATLDNPNFMATTNPDIVNNTTSWIEGMKTHSVSLTANKELFKKKFFDTLIDRIDYFDKMG